jgi:hypothetical protein
VSSTYLDLTNTVLGPFNEVLLTSSNFTSAVGFHAEAKRYILQSIFDVYTYQDTEWPFLWNEYTVNTVEGTSAYSKDTDVTSIDWDSFHIQRATATVSSVTSSSTTATVTTSAAHNFETGDNICIAGATPTGYNGNVTITVTGSTTFTYTVTSGLTTPATGTITAKSNTVLRKLLELIDYDKWERDFAWRDDNLNADGYGSPTMVVRKPDNNFILSTVADRVYTVGYKGFEIPTAMSAYTDTCLIPTAFEQVITDKALHYAYMFRDNIEQANLVEKRYEDNIHKMRRILIPQAEYMKV